MSVVQTRGGLVPWWKRRGGLWGALSLSGGGGIVRTSSPSLPGGRTPLVQHRPRVTYSGTAKGPLLGGLPIVSGLEGVCEAWKDGERG